MHEFVQSTSVPPNPIAAQMARQMLGIVTDVHFGKFGEMRLKVKIHNSELLEDVVPLLSSVGGGSGSLTAAPKIGSECMVIQLNAGNGASRNIYLGGIEFINGERMIRTDLISDLELSSDGSGVASESNGNRTYWGSNGDYEYAGNGSPTRPQLVDKNNAVIDAPVTVRPIKRFFEWAYTTVARWRVGRNLFLTLDAIKREAMLLVGKTGVAVSDGLIELQADMVTVGTRPKAARPVALAAPVETTLNLLIEEVALLKSRIRSGDAKHNALERALIQFIAATFLTHTHPGIGVPPVPIVPPTPDPLLPFLSPHDAQRDKKIPAPQVRSERLYAE